MSSAAAEMPATSSSASATPSTMRGVESVRSVPPAAAMAARTWASASGASVRRRRMAVVVGSVPSRGAIRASCRGRSISAIPERRGGEIGPRSRRPHRPRGDHTEMAAKIIHVEVAGKDGPALQRFYSDVFGWELNTDNPGGYGLVRQGDVTGGSARRRTAGRPRHVLRPRRRPGRHPAPRRGAGWSRDHAAHRGRARDHHRSVRRPGGPRRRADVAS